MDNPSRHLSPRQFRGLEKLGDAYLPGDAQFPSFSACGCAEHVDCVLDYLPEDDRRDLKRLLWVLSLKPQFALTAGVWMLEKTADLPIPLGGLLRFLRFGLKGLVISLYYSGETGTRYHGPSPLDLLDYHVSVYTGDLGDAKGENSQSAVLK